MPFDNMEDLGAFCRDLGGSFTFFEQVGQDCEAAVKCWAALLFDKPNRAGVIADLMYMNPDGGPVLGHQSGNYMSKSQKNNVLSEIQKNNIVDQSVPGTVMNRVAKRRSTLLGWGRVDKLRSIIIYNMATIVGFVCTNPGLYMLSIRNRSLLNRHAVGFDTRAMLKFFDPNMGEFALPHGKIQEFNFFLDGYMRAEGIWARGTLKHIYKGGERDLYQFVSQNV